MVDVPIGVGGVNTAAIQAAANKAGYGIALVSLYLMIIFGLIALVGFILYRKSFNIRVTVIDSNGILIRDDYRGKMNQVRPGEFRFKIYKDKANKLRYNQESLSPDDLINDVNAKGKLSKRLFMTIDSEGQLVPIKITFDKLKVHVQDSAGNPVYDKQMKPVYEETTIARARVKQVDIAWYYKELDKSTEVFDARSFFDKNGWIILAICLALTLGVFMFTAYKFSSAASKMGDVVAAQSELIKFLALASNSSQGGILNPI